MAIDANIILQGQTPNYVNALLGGFQAGSAIKNQPAVDEMFQEKLAMVKGQRKDQDVERERQIARMQLQDMALDAIKIRPLLESGDTLRANVFIAERIKKIQQRGGDPSDTMAFRDALNSGQLTPQQAIGELDSVLEGARQAGVLDGASGRGIRPGFVGSPQRVTENGQNYLTGLYQDEYGNVTEKRVPVSGEFVMGAPTVQDVGGVKTIVDPSTRRAYLPTLQQPIDGQAPTGNIPPPTPVDAAMTAQNAATVEGGKEAGKQAIQMSGEALKKLPDVRRAISNIDQAIAAVEKGANTGVIASRFPSVTAASIELDNLRGSMGLDVIAGTTFGALSEAELGFALDTALPTRLSGPELKAWLTRKKEAQGKLAKELEEAAIYLGKPGNTPAGWLEMKRNQQGASRSADVKTMSDEDLLKALGN